MPKITVNEKETEFEEGLTVLQVCELAGAEIPKFWHRSVSTGMFPLQYHSLIN